MSNQEIIKSLIEGHSLNYGVHGRNMDIVEFMADLERHGLITITDVSLSQETRYEARWKDE